MKRRISLVIALILSFLMMFISIAKAEEIEVPISLPTSEPTEIEIINKNKFPFTETNQVNCPLSRENSSNRVLAEGKKTSELEENQVGVKCGDCTLQNGEDGQCVRYENGLCVDCKPCVKANCGECTTSNGACGRCWWTIGPDGRALGSSCQSCGNGQLCGSQPPCPASIPDN